MEKDFVFHKYITVNSDEQKKENFAGNLADFAAKKLSEWKLSKSPTARIISIESHYYTNEIRPKQNNSSTWYTQEAIQLSVWLERQ